MIINAFDQEKEGEAEWKVMKDRNRIMLGMSLRKFRYRSPTDSSAADVWS